MANASAEALIAALKQAGLLDAPTEAAFRAIPRAAFLPNLPPEQVYKDEAVPVKVDEDGTVLSSSSQPSMMAIMLRQLDLQRGQSILEIGTGTGYNAALMQHIVGETGRVTSIEIDSTVAEGARANLQRVTMGAVLVVESDGALGYVPRANYDRIIATAGIWDVPNAWVRQLRPKGRLVAPIWLDGTEVSAAFTLRSDGSLYSDDNRMCAFLRLRGQASGPEVVTRVGTSSLYLGASTLIDSAAIHILLSDDAQDSYLGVTLDQSEYWHSFLPYLVLNIPQDFMLIRYTVSKDAPAYGLTGSGFALMIPGSICFLPLAGRGSARSYGGSDATLALEDTLANWERAGKPQQERLRLSLVPKGKATAQLGKVYPRREHDMIAWMELEGGKHG